MSGCVLNLKSSSKHGLEELFVIWYSNKGDSYLKPSEPDLSALSLSLPSSWLSSQMSRNSSLVSVTSSL